MDVKESICNKALPQIATDRLWTGLIHLLSASTPAPRALAQADTAKVASKLGYCGVTWRVKPYLLYLDADETRATAPARQTCYVG